MGPSSASLFRCGVGGPYFPDYGGVQISPAGWPQKPVGAEFRLTATVTRPHVPQPSPGCSRALEGIDSFHHVNWSWHIDGPLDVQLVSCPCQIIRTDENRRGRPSDWIQTVTAAPLGPGDYVFAVRAVKPGLGSLAVAGFLNGPCGTGAPGDPVNECGAYSQEIAFVTVVADETR